MGAVGQVVVDRRRADDDRPGETLGQRVGLLGKGEGAPGEHQGRIVDLGHRPPAPDTHQIEVGTCGEGRPLGRLDPVHLLHHGVDGAEGGGELPCPRRVMRGQGLLAGREGRLDEGEPELAELSDGLLGRILPEVVVGHRLPPWISGRITARAARIPALARGERQGRHGSELPGRTVGPAQVRGEPAGVSPGAVSKASARRVRSANRTQRAHALTGGGGRRRADRAFSHPPDGPRSAARSFGSAVPIGSRINSSASSSYGVGSALTIDRRAPCSAAIPASDAAGCT